MPEFSISLPDACPECGAGEMLTDYAAGDVICRQCGLVVEGNCIDDSAEWRTFQNEGGGGNEPQRAEKPSATGEGLSGMVGGSIAMQRAHREVVDQSRDLVLSKAIDLVRPMVAHLNLPVTIFDACKQILVDLNNEGHLKRKATDAHMCAVVALACRDARDQSAARSFREIADAFPPVTFKEIGQKFVKLSRLRSEANKPVRILVAQDLLGRFCARLRVDIEGERAARAILDAVSKYGLSRGQQQASQAAAAILYATKHLTCGGIPATRDIAAVAKVSEMTIQSSYQDLAGSKTGALLNRLFADEMAKVKAARERPRAAGPYDR